MGRTIVKTLSAILISATMGGCMVGPDYHPPEMHVPSRFSAATQPAATEPSATQPATQPAAQIDLRRWWDTFDDPKLNELIGRGLNSNLDVQLAQARVLEARAQVQFNVANLLPMVNGTASYTRSQASKNAVAFSGPGTAQATSGFAFGRTNLYQAGFDAGWELDVFGGTRRAIEAAQGTLEAQVEARRNALVTLLSEIARDYINLRGFQHELAIVQNNVVSQRDTLNLTRSKFEAGIATDLDVAQIEALVASTESQIPTLQTQIAQSIHQLAVLLDEPIEKMEQELSPPAPLPAGPPVVPAGLPSELIRRRPDVREAERQLAAASANIGVAVSDLFPKFNLTGSLGLESLSLKKFADGGSGTWSFGPSVSWKIFSAGQVQANIHVQDARAQEAYIQYRQAVIQSLADVEDALVAYDKEQTRLQALRRSVAANRRAVSLARQLNTAGVVDFLNVLTSEQSLYVAEDQLAVSEQTVSTDLIALYKALGGGWELTDQIAEAAPENPTGSN
ncbi:MAG TPA: efflux transporter outer membrane subunit [Tepidisphaeraceae bacterium]|jgi:multidrug efflux system outer membrane protein|nr:efflux transporter outer membrane subunit [Tepidisphaeraceae bacterium]